MRDDGRHDDADDSLGRSSPRLVGALFSTEQKPSLPRPRISTVQTFDFPNYARGISHQHTCHKAANVTWNLGLSGTGRMGVEFLCDWRLTIGSGLWVGHQTVSHSFANSVCCDWLRQRRTNDIVLLVTSIIVWYRSKK